MSIVKRLFGSWHVSFGRLGVNDAGGDYVLEEIRIVPKLSAENRYGVVCWHDKSKKFRGSIVSFLPAKPTVLHPLVAPASVVSTTRGYEVSRPEEEYLGGFVRILRFDDSDPIGKYEMDVLVDGKCIATIVYEVI